jgi:hypothetical protein
MFPAFTVVAESAGNRRACFGSRGGACFTFFGVATVRAAHFLRPLGRVDCAEFQALLATWFPNAGPLPEPALEGGTYGPGRRPRQVFSFYRVQIGKS